MAASDHLQLKLFMSAREIGDSVSAYGDFGQNPGGLPHEAMRTISSDVLERKKNNFGRSGLQESVQTHGVKKPLDITHDSGGMMLANGHHRLIAQSQADPDRLIPVVHTRHGESRYHGRGGGNMSYETYNMIGSQYDDPTGDVHRRSTPVP
jgi:hypothetical protein